jgi:hypothetical protein
MHDYELDLAGRTHTRTFHQEQAIAFSAMDAALNGEKGVYASSELTTGRRAYALCTEHGVRNGHELRAKLGDDPHRSLVLERNMEEASEFARRLRRELGGRDIVISPAPFGAPGWSQAEYLHFWETLIRTRVKKVYFNEWWQFSNGCTFEYAIAVEAGVPTFSADGAPLPVERAARMVAAAVRELDAAGMDTERLRLHLGRLSAAAV